MIPPVTTTAPKVQQPARGIFEDIKVGDNIKWVGTAALIPGAVAGLTAASAHFITKARGGASTIPALTAGPRVAAAGGLLVAEALLLSQVNWPSQPDANYYIKLGTGAVLGGATAAALTGLAIPRFLTSGPKTVAALALYAGAIGAAIGGGLAAWQLGTNAINARKNGE